MSRHFTRDEVDALAIAYQATYHQPQQMWLMTGAELHNIVNAAADAAIAKLHGKPLLDQPSEPNNYTDIISDGGFDPRGKP